MSRAARRGGVARRAREDADARGRVPSRHFSARVGRFDSLNSSSSCPRSTRCSRRARARSRVAHRPRPRRPRPRRPRGCRARARGLRTRSMRCVSPTSRARSTRTRRGRASAMRWARADDYNRASPTSVCARRGVLDRGVRVRRQSDDAVAQPPGDDGVHEGAVRERDRDVVRFSVVRGREQWVGGVASVGGERDGGTGTGVRREVRGTECGWREATASRRHLRRR